MLVVNARHLDIVQNFRGSLFVFARIFRSVPAKAGAITFSILEIEVLNVSDTRAEFDLRPCLGECFRRGVIRVEAWAAVKHCCLVQLRGRQLVEQPGNKA